MPCRTRKIKDTNAVVLEHLCEECGKPAYYGYNVHIERAFKARDKGQLGAAKELLGKWYCLKHKKEADVNTDL